MNYKGFNAGIFFRVILLVILAFITVYSIVDKQWFFTPLVSGILLFIVILELIRYLQYYTRSLNNFLVAIRQSGFNASFREDPKKGNDLFRTFNQIIKSFQQLALEKETHYQFLKTLTDHIEAGIIVFQESGKIEWINPEAKQLINKPGIDSLNNLKKFQPILAKEIEDLLPGRKSLLTIIRENDPVEISLQVSRIALGGKVLKLALLQNIHREMEIKEVEAWQKLTRVMRHEIMNSMTPIVNLSEAVNKVMASKESVSALDPDFRDIQESLIAIENRSKGLVKFVNAYKDFSKMPELSISEFTVVSMIDKIKSLLENELSSRKSDLNLNIKPDTLKITGDEELLEQVIINLIKNSLEAFDENGGTIEVFCRKDGDKCLIRITDNGPGIEPEVLDRIFIPFFTTKSKGSGIGLSLSRQIIHQHGGSINVVSSLNSGTRFNIEI